MESYLEECRLDYWNGAASLVLTESRSLRGVLEGVCREYRVLIGSVNGQCAGYLHNDLTPVLANAERPVLYLGDWDFSGGHIEQNTCRVLETNIGSELSWKRLALTEEEVEEYNLPIIQKHDKRTNKTHEAVETEALSQQVIVDILTKELQVLVQVDPKKIQAAERKQRKELRKLLADLQEDAN